MNFIVKYTQHISKCEGNGLLIVFFTLLEEDFMAVVQQLFLVYIVFWVTSLGQKY